jgi:hypothetical protein
LSIRVGCKRDTGLRRKKMGGRGLEEAREEKSVRERGEKEREEQGEEPRRGARDK